ncbi:MAG TPA: DUF4197 domain-containing protein [Chitinophagales bacterium]|mgnify:FL=1|jgi:hypothetical protein|nr:DUF4197 domain-containing protein [Chitinophagales bacterium]MBP6155052.1 DUF4197 domain-containing protein [Chitinophagales bacterium]HQV77321.1 DUF4197 domain-containing protein [Chitinophagales bacterium]HQW78382.1 DUF4197 domain-containing protein [Chitinophagales bacterium]HRB66790.1 DUF4197 domain-containing protein [Chitinophagales bacterium]
MKKFFGIFLISIFLFGCTAQQIQDTVSAVLGSSMGDPTEQEAGQGLKDALGIGITQGMGLLAKQDGFLGNDLVKIPWPNEAQKVKDVMLNLGMQKQVDNVTTSLNRAAEKASGVAIDVFIQVIKQMTVTDAINIITGGNGAGTAFLKKAAAPILTEKFRPIVNQSLGQVNATKYWTDATSIYNKIPMVKPVNTDLTGFVTDKALEGVFKMVEKEENKIRENPLSRTTEILKKVFGFADRKK